MFEFVHAGKIGGFENGAVEGARFQDLKIKVT